MKILILSIKNPFSAKDGGSLAILNVLEGYSNLGYEITLLMMNPNRHFSDLATHTEIIEKLKIKVIEHQLNIDIKPLKVISNLLFSELPYNIERFYDTEFEMKLEKLIQEEQFDIIQLEGSYLGLYLNTLKKKSHKTSIVLRAHNVEAEIWERNAKIQKSYIKRKFFEIIAKRFKKWEDEHFIDYDAIIPISFRDEQIIKSICPSVPFHTLPFTIDLSRYPQNEILLDDLSLAYLGALDWIPNQEGLIWFLDNVWERIESYYEGLNFYIAGRNAPEWLEKKIKSYRVIYLGEIEDAKKYILEHPIFVVPLMSGSGMRIKIIEQMALGRVVLATPIAAEGIDIVHTENGLICEDSDDFIESIDFMFRNPDGIRNISENARATVESLYDSKEVFESLGHFLKQI